jgi:alkylation response protein AidB-like acyl-CoA dehydrogenase
MDAGIVLENVREVSDRFAAERSERQQRRALVADDFAQLREAGFTLTGAPVDQGGIWKSVHQSTRLYCELLRTLAHGDSSVALVCAMHPTVLSFWLTQPRVPEPFQAAWEAQRRHHFQTVCEGAWWGTASSEPGSGGDVSKTKTVARPSATDGDYRLTGQKAFGSGSGITSYVMTIAVPEGETGPDVFYLDMRNVAWDGASGVTLTAPWDGHGMTATQSHALRFTDFPATRIAWPGHVPDLMGSTGGLNQCLFTAVIVGIVETALEEARQQVARRRDSLRAYEKVEWTKADQEGWLIQQAYDGMIRAVEEGRDGRRNSVQGKMAIAELAESVTGRICRVLGGGTFSRSSPFGHWHEDVRSLGFLRPPWGLAYDNLFMASLAGLA